jgi:hypothetical protein
MKCLARITREYKTKKADCIWPESVYGPNDEKDLPPEVCGGEIKVVLTPIVDGGCSCCGSPRIQVEITCSRCKFGYFPGSLNLDQRANSYGGWDITDLMEPR